MIAKEIADAPETEISYDSRSPTQELRHLLLRTGLSQRQAARDLGVDERTMRYWCAGQHEPPRMALLALQQLGDGMRRIEDHPIALPSPSAPKVTRYLKQEIRFWWDDSDEAIHVTTVGTKPPLHTTFEASSTSARWHASMFKWLSGMLRASGKAAPKERS